MSGAEYVLEVNGFRERAARQDLVVTGEGTVDRTTFEGKAPGEALRICRELGVRCVLFGGRVRAGEAQALSGDPDRARDDLVALGLKLASLGRSPGVDGQLANLQQTLIVGIGLLLRCIGLQHVCFSGSQ